MNFSLLISGSKLNISYKIIVLAILNIILFIIYFSMIFFTSFFLIYFCIKYDLLNNEHLKENESKKLLEEKCPSTEMETFQ